MYKVTHEGFRSEAISASGEKLHSGLYCRGDRSLLERGMEKAKAAGQIVSYEIAWVSIEQGVQ